MHKCKQFEFEQTQTNTAFMSQKKKVVIYKQDFIASSIHDPELKVEKYKLIETLYDENDGILSEIRYSPDGQVEFKEEYKYDTNGKLIEEINYFDEETIADHISYERDSQGKILKGFKHYEDGSKDRIIYKYNDAGKLLEKITLDEDDEEDSREERDYDDNKLVKKMIWEDGELISTIIYKYDKDQLVTVEEENNADERYILQKINTEGKVFESLHYNRKKELIEKTNIDYNKEGITTRVIFENQIQTRISEIILDTKGNAIEQIEKTRGGDTIGKIKRVFNDHNDIITTEVHLDPLGNEPGQHYVLEYQYEIIN